MARASLTLWTDADRDKLCKWARGLPKGSRIEAKSPRRSVDQNRLMWSLLKQVADQLPWFGQMLCDEDWKDIFSAGFSKARVVPGLDPGTVVPLGIRTSDMSKEEMTNFIEFIFAEGTQRGVEFRENG